MESSIIEGDQDLEGDGMWTYLLCFFAGSNTAPQREFGSFPSAFSLNRSFRHVF